MATITVENPGIKEAGLTPQSIAEHLEASYRIEARETAKNLNKIRIPCPNAQLVKIRYSALPRQGKIDVLLEEPKTKLELGWQYAALQNQGDNWWEIDLSTLKLSDGGYEYEFLVTRNNQEFIASDPYAEEITRFGGYRGIFYIVNSQRVRPDISWDNELVHDKPLSNNNEIIIYELPVRWVDTVESCSECYDRHVGLGTFDQVIFEKLQYFIDLGINAIELLPVLDSPDTLNWGYGTRFFFTIDYDMGTPLDLKLFVKLCHQNGIRVIMDLVMNHASQKCPLKELAEDCFFVDNQDGRLSWGGKLFWYDTPINNTYYSRDFHYGVAEYLIKEYHIDGFRLDEFVSIKNYDFVEEFRSRARDTQQTTFPGRPFIVIAEDTWRRAEITQDMNWCNNKIAPVVDSMWDFTFRDELRRLVTNTIYTNYGEPSRFEHAKAMINGKGVIDGNHWRQMYNARIDAQVPASYSDMSQRVTYCTSHDIEAESEQRLFPFFLEQMKNSNQPEDQFKALRQTESSFALMLTSVGIPMALGGEEFAELQDVDHRNWREKMSSGIDWTRADAPGRDTLRKQITELIKLRTSHPALHRNEVEFFYVHPHFDDNNDARVFAYCRTGGVNLGSPGQVIIVANCGPQSYNSFKINGWLWGSQSLKEYGGTLQALPKINNNEADLELLSYQVRVFST